MWYAIFESMRVLIYKCLIMLVILVVSFLILKIKYRYWSKIINIKNKYI